MIKLEWTKENMRVLNRIGELLRELEALNEVSKAKEGLFLASIKEGENLYQQLFNALETVITETLSLKAISFIVTDIAPSFKIYVNDNTITY